MTYELFYTEKAVSQLAALPVEFVDGIELNLLRLAEAPASLSIPIASPPFPPRGQLYHFRLKSHTGRVWFFTVIFRYSQNETGLHILTVLGRELPDES